MKRTYEIQVCIPSGCRLVGCKTDGDIAVVIFEDVSGPEIRQIGFIREPTTSANSKRIICRTWKPYEHYIITKNGGAAGTGGRRIPLSSVRR